MVLLGGSKIQVKVVAISDNPFAATKKRKTSFISSTDANP